ncbi:unnamed protein product, partial [Rotaria sp. Silwood2]
MRFGVGHPTVLTNHQEQCLVELLKNLEFIALRLMKVVAMKLLRCVKSSCAVL